mmetsp:Transcript_64335/g.112217  ORF Transcript_64335/g.112217 Transcript_64335/m.112217 type:complete len:384 (+) Transcript_64335:54-1205(+)
MTLAKILFVLVCLACVGWGRRVQTAAAFNPSGAIGHLSRPNVRSQSPAISMGNEKDPALAFGTLSSRRSLLAAAASILGAGVVAPSPVLAVDLLGEVRVRQPPPRFTPVPDVRDAFGDNAASKVENYLRPEVRPLLRQRLDQDFAVLLMRSSYSVADELDFMPMDKFQKELFEIRSNEWQIYKDKVNVMQGDLTDPNYFDFMSFVQYATIANGMRNGVLFFNELIDANGTTQVVSRDTNTIPADNKELPRVHSERVGNRILNWLGENTPEQTPQVLKAPVDENKFLSQLKLLATAFKGYNYMLDYDLKLLPDKGGVSVTLTAPATLWSAQVLDIRGDTPVNDFFAKTTLSWLQQCGISATVNSRVEEGFKIIHDIRWRQKLLV